MRGKLTYKTLALLLMVLMCLPGGLPRVWAENAGTEMAQYGKLHPRVQADMAEKDILEVLIKVTGEADPAGAAKGARKNLPATATRAEEKKAVRRAVVDALIKNAAQSQAAILQELKQGTRRGSVLEISEYFITNMIYIKAHKDVILQLAQRPDVVSITPDFTITREEPIYTTGVTSLSGSGIPWNLNTVKAPQVWNDFQMKGSGVVIGIIDTGADWQHPALMTQWRGYNPANPASPCGEYNWYDVINHTSLPSDAAGHGTHVTGTILGQDAAAGKTIGVAPGAQWIAVKAFQGESASASDLIAAGQYMLAPTNAAGTPQPEQAPDIVNNSWGGKADPAYYEWYRDMVRAWRSAGILPVFAAGNTGAEGENSILTPASYPESFAIAATDSSNKLASFSSRGPGFHQGVLKPDISAPGVSILSAWPGGGYAYGSGTSMAAPHVAGAAALLLAANPNLTPEDMEEALKGTALALTDAEYPTSPNAGYGSGLVDAHAAMVWTQDTGIKRIFGASRYETAIEVSKKGWNTAETVFLARGDDYADALAGVPLAYRLNAPILLTPAGFLPGEVAAEIQRLQAAKAVILGGSGAVCEAISLELAGMGLKVERIEGPNRFATAAAVAKTFDPAGVDTAVIAYGLNFPDALAAASYAAQAGMPILLTAKDTVPPDTLDALDYLGVSQVLVVGGTGIISDNVLAQLPPAVRVCGDNRYATAVAITEHFAPLCQHMFIATGTSFADAVTGAVLAAKQNSGILMVLKDGIPPEVAAYLETQDMKGFSILGGTGAVGPEVEKGLKAYLQ